MNNYQGDIAKIFLMGADSYEKVIDVQFWNLVTQFSSKEAASILDLGCGPGRDLAIAHSHFPDATLVGVDLSSDMCDLAKERNPLADIRNESFTTTGLPDGEFDLVISRYALQSHSEPDECWQEINRLLKPGAVCVCLITHPISNYLKKDSNYFVQENIHVDIFDAIHITEPTHTFQDWLSKTFFSFFDLCRFEEGKQQSERKYPSFFILAFKKKVRK